MRKGISYCKVCHNISETEVCPICSDQRRDRSTICVVESVKDVMILENTGQYGGLYHVLGGIISPIDGVSPDMLEIDSLVQRVASGDIKEVILALGATMEGDTTGYYLYRRLAPYPKVKITQLARGVALGNEIEYTDELTLGRSLQNRTLFADSIKA
jgi:recombination protein RecR